MGDVHQRAFALDGRAAFAPALLVGVHSRGASRETGFRRERRNQPGIDQTNGKEPIAQLDAGHRHGQGLTRRSVEQSHND